MTLSPEQRHYMAHRSPERAGDRAIRRGDFESAREEFTRVFRTDRLPYDRKGRVALKEIALPMYEMEWRSKIGRPVDLELQARIDACHAEAAELLNYCLKDIRELRASSHSPTNTAHMLGLISELTIYTLGARRLNRKGDFYFVPSSTDEDFAKAFAADLRLVSADKAGKSTPVQVKTSNRKNRFYSSAVNIVAVQNLDPEHYSKPEHPDSLASSLTREIAGSADDTTLQHLNEVEEDLINHLKRRFELNTNVVA